MTAAVVLAGAAAALAVTGIGLLVESRARDRGPPLLRLLARAGGQLRPTAPRDLDARIAAAGRPPGLGTRELMAAKLAAAALGAAGGLVLASAAPARPALLLLLGGPVGGFLAPDLWLARRAAERARRIRHELPALLDLLRVLVESGSSLP